MAINEIFHQLMQKRASKLLNVAGYFSRHEEIRKIMTRPLLGEFMSQSIQLEEILDAYGARNNQQWHTFRALIAAIKLFSDVSYEILHIKHVLPKYCLLEIEDDFIAATKNTLDFTGKILLKTSKRSGF